MIRQLLDEIMGMVIDESVDKVSTKRIKCVREVKVLGNGRWAIDRQKMCSTRHTIQMNDRECAVSSIALKLRLHDPQPGVLIGLITRHKPIDERARIISVIECKWKKEKSAGNCHARHSIKPGIGFNKHRITSSVFSTPVWVWADAFPVHPTSPTKITGRIETRSRRMVNTDWPTKVRAIVDVDVWNVRVRVKLFVEEVPKELWKLWLIDIGCKIVNSPWVPSY